MFHRLLVRFLFPSLLFSSNLAILSYCSDHLPRVISNENALHSQSHPDSNGMWALAPSANKHVEYVPRLTAPTEITESNHSNVELHLALPQSPQPIPPSHLSGDHTHHNIKYLEQLLDDSLATVAVIQFSGNTLADVLTPRANDALKALYTLAALDAPTSSTHSIGSEIPTRSTFSDIGNDCPYSSNPSPPLPNSSLAVPHPGRIHISISMEYVILFSWAGLAAVCCFFFFFSICLGFVKGFRFS